MKKVLGYYLHVLWDFSFVGMIKSIGIYDMKCKFKKYNYTQQIIIYCLLNEKKFDFYMTNTKYVVCLRTKLEFC